jgi:hypothetical protein
LVASALLVAGPAVAFAEGSESTSTEEFIAPAFAITSPTNQQFLPENSVTITGTKTVDSTVAVSIGGSTGCTPPATDEPLTTWSCSTILPNGRGVVITATETLDDGSTAASSITVDVLGAPKISPAPPQQSPGKASGTGFPGSRIDLIVNGASQSCTALVAPGGQWLCTIAGGPNTYTVTATQSQNWGTSNSSSAVTLVVNPAPPVEPPPAPQPAPAQPSPVLPAPKPVVPEEQAPEPEPAPSQTPDDRSDADSTLPWLDRPIFPGPGGRGPTIREALTNWGTPTGFGAGLPTLGDAFSGGNVLWALLLAVAFIGLIAVPLRLLASALREQLVSRPQLAGRNQRIAGEEPKAGNPWVAGLVPLAATAGLIVLAEGLNGEVRYLRLLFAVGAGLAILNVVGVAIGTRIASRALGVSGRLRFLPILMVAAAIATLIARLTGMEPPLVGGVLIAVGFALGMPARPRALVGLAQVGGILILALLAWFGHSLVGPVEGFWASVLSETMATVCLAGVGSALILMLPVGALPGRVVLEWSRLAWLAATLPVATVAATVLLGGTQVAFPLLATVLVVAAFAAVCVAVWAWTNYVQVARA